MPTKEKFFYTFLIKIKHYHSNKRRKCCTNNNIFFYLHLTPTLQKYIRAHTVIIKTYTWADCRKRGFSQSRPAVQLSTCLSDCTFTCLLDWSTYLLHRPFHSSPTKSSVHMHSISERSYEMGFTIAGLRSLFFIIKEKRYFLLHWGPSAKNSFISSH